MDDDNFKIHGYNSTKVNRQNKGGGGICIFARENIKIKTRNDLVNEESNSNTLFRFIENAKMLSWAYYIDHQVANLMILKRTLKQF